MMFFSSASAHIRILVLLPLAEELCWFSIMVSEGDYRIMDSSKKIGEAVVCRKSL